jgi:SAM-dependent methyltransferase
MKASPGAMTFTDSKERFSNRVADYLRYRPGYPTAVIDWVRSECGLRPGHVIGDVGSGTGLLSELFLKNGNRVYGVEPNEAMRKAGLRELHFRLEFEGSKVAFDAVSRDGRLAHIERQNHRDRPATTAGVGA